MSEATTAAAIEAEGASVTRGGKPVWSDISLRIEGGEFVAILGPNGAGKSTFLHVLLGLLSLRQGSVRVFGGRPGEENSRIGYLPQRRSFDSSVHIRGVDLVRLGLDGARWGVPLPFGSRQREVSQQVSETIELVDASSYARRPIGELSGGEQQRLLVAQAMVSGSELLMLDEPLDSLDLPNQRAVAALLQRICRERGVTVLLVAHDVNPVLPYLDRVVYFANGSAIGGDPREVINDQTLTALYGVPIEVLQSSDGRLVVVGQPESPSLHTPRH